MESQRHSSGSIDLRELLMRCMKGLKRMWFIVLALALVCAAVFLARAYISYTPRYEARAVFSISSGYSADDILSYSYYYDNAMAEQLAASFPYILDTDVMRELIMQELGRGYINGSIAAESVANTNMFVLTVRSASASDAYDILNAVINSYPQVASYMVDSSQIVIKNAPTTPTAPYNSFSWKLPIAKGFAIGLAVGLAIVLFTALASKTVYSAKELRDMVSLPLLGAIPKVNLKKTKRGAREPSILEPRIGPAFIESVRGLRVKLIKPSSGASPKAILVTSTLPGEGKTTVAINLALSLADAGHSTVLVDFDLRKQSIRTALAMPADMPGLVECIGQDGPSPLKCVSRVPGSELDVISGASNPKRQYQLDSRKVQSVLRQLRAAYDYVVIDTPPCGIISDAGYLARFADRVLYVVRQDYATRGQILDALQSLYDRKARMAGCVLNAAPRGGRISGYGKYGYGYGKTGYGYGSYRSYGAYGSYGKYGAEKAETAENDVSDAGNGTEK